MLHKGLQGSGPWSPVLQSGCSHPNVLWRPQVGSQIALSRKEAKQTHTHRAQGDCYHPGQRVYGCWTMQPEANYELLVSNWLPWTELEIDYAGQSQGGLCQHVPLSKLVPVGDWKQVVCQYWNEVGNLDSGNETMYSPFTGSQLRWQLAQSGKAGLNRWGQDEV